MLFLVLNNKVQREKMSDRREVGLKKIAHKIQFSHT